MEKPDFKQMAKDLEKMSARMRNDRKNSHQSAYIKSKAIETGQIHGVEYWIVPGPRYERELIKIAPSLADMGGGLNGYAVFPRNWIKEKFYGGILDYVPVHWGITYNEEDELGQVFGFDTAHTNSNEYPRTDSAWIREQLDQMIRGLNMAHGVEARYLAARSHRKRGYYAQKVFGLAEQPERGMGMMMKMLGMPL